MNDNVVLTGSVSSSLESTRAADLAARFAGDPKKVVNMLSVAGGAQVMLKVRIAEMDRNIAKQFGINLASAANIDGVPIVAATSNPYGLLGTALSNLSGAQIGASCGAAFVPTITGTITTTVTNNVSTNPAILQPGAANGITTTNNTTTCTAPNNAQGVLNALEQVGLVHMLAEPNLTAVSGETAKFLAGGEFPVPGRPRPAGQHLHRVQAVRRRPFLHAGGAVAGPHQPAALHRSQRTHQYRRLHAAGRHTASAYSAGHHPGLVRAPRRDHGRTAFGRQLRDRRPDAAQHQAGG